MEIVMLIAGLVFAGFGGFMLRDELKFRQHADENSGQVMAIETSVNSKGQTMYAPVVRYQHQGEAREFIARISSSACSYDIGDSVAILVSQTTPPEARLKSPGMLVFSSVFLAIGIGCSIAFFVIFEASAFSLGMAAFIMLAIFIQTTFVLKKHRIYSIDDLKRKIEDIKRNKPSSLNPSPSEHKQRITNRQTLHTKTHKPTPLWFCFIFLLAGLGMSGGGIYTGFDRWAFLQNAHATTGIVVDFERSTRTSDGKTTTTYAPVIEYIPHGSHEKITFTDDFGSSSPSEHVGDQADVLYLADDPHEAIMDKGWLNWFGPGLLSLLGIVFTLIALSMTRRNRQLKKKQHPIKLDF